MRPFKERRFVPPGGGSGQIRADTEGCVVSSNIDLMNTTERMRVCEVVHIPGPGVSHARAKVGVHVGVQVDVAGVSHPEKKVKLKVET